MVGRGGGRKLGYHKIAPGKLQSYVQKNIIGKHKVAGINNEKNTFITDEIALLVTKNLDRQRKTCTAKQTESPNLVEHNVLRHVAEFENIASLENAGNGSNNSCQNEMNNSPEHHDFDQESEGLIHLVDEGLLGKRKRETNFSSRIEVGLQLNKALDPRPRQNIFRNPTGHVNGNEIGENTATSMTRGRGKRGRYKSYVVDMKIKGKGSKLKVTIPDEIDRAIGENAQHLVNECGRIVRTRAPFDVKNWNEAFKVSGDCMLKEIKEKFEIVECGDYLRMYMFVLDTMQRLYRLFKCRLHYYYKKCGKTDDERKKNPPPDLPKTQWEYLVKHFGSDSFKAASTRNSKNRNSDRRVKHTTGNLSFPESEEILTKKNGNVKPSADVIWLIQHTHKNEDGHLEWLNGDTRSKEIHENLKNVVASVGDSMTQEEILIQVLGQSSLYIRGKGTAVRGYAKGKAQAEQRKLVQQQQEKIQVQEQKIKELEESQLKRQEEFEAYKAKQHEEMESFKKGIMQQLLDRGVL